MVQNLNSMPVISTTDIHTINTFQTIFFSKIPQKTSIYCTFRCLGITQALNLRELMSVFCARRWSSRVKNSRPRAKRGLIESISVSSVSTLAWMGRPRSWAVVCKAESIAPAICLKWVSNKCLHWFGSLLPKCDALIDVLQQSICYLLASLLFRRNERIGLEGTLHPHRLIRLTMKCQTPQWTARKHQYQPRLRNTYQDHVNKSWFSPIAIAHSTSQHHSSSCKAARHRSRCCQDHWMDKQSSGSEDQ